MNWYEAYDLSDGPDASATTLSCEGKIIATFTDPELHPEHAKAFMEFIIDPRSSSFTEGFVAGLALQNDEFFEIKAALGWLSKEHSKLAAKFNPADAEDVYREAREAGRQIVKEAGGRP